MLWSTYGAMWWQRCKRWPPCYGTGFATGLNWHDPNPWAGARGRGRTHEEPVSWIPPWFFSAHIDLPAGHGVASIGRLPCWSSATAPTFFFWPAPVAFRRVTTWSLLADQRGIEPPPAVCPRRQERRPTNWATRTPVSYSTYNPGPALSWRNDKSEVNRESSSWSDMDMRPLLVFMLYSDPKAVPSVSPWSLCVNGNLGSMEANVMAGRALFGRFQLPDGLRRCAIFLVQEKVMQGTSRSAFPCISSNCPEVTWASPSLQACRICLLWPPSSATASGGRIFWPSARLAAAYCFPCKLLCVDGRNGIPWWHTKWMWIAGVCTGQPGATPVDNGHSPAQYPSAKNDEWTQDKTDRCIGPSALSLIDTHRSCSPRSTWWVHARQPTLSARAWGWACPHCGSSIVPGDPHWPIWPLYRRRFWCRKDSFPSSFVNCPQLRTKWLLWARQWLAQNSLLCLLTMLLDGSRLGNHTLFGQQLLLARWPLPQTRLWLFSVLQTKLPESHAAGVGCAPPCDYTLPRAALSLLDWGLDSTFEGSWETLQYPQ